MDLRTDGEGTVQLLDQLKRRLL